MEAINEVTDSNLLSKIRSGMTWDSSYCFNHIPTMYTQENTSPEEWIVFRDKFKVQMIVMDGQTTCPRCELDKQDAIFARQVNKELYEQQASKKLNTLAKCSILQDETIKLARFDNYKEALGPEEATNKAKAWEYVKRFIAGEQFNLWIQSEITGVGKSHLAMSILKALNSLERSCLYLDIDEMLRKIRGSFDNKDSKYTEQYFIDLATEVDFLVLDDLGAETGDIDTKKRASDYTSKILRAIANGRQHKSTIVTTNLKSTQLNGIYDRKVISRLMANIEIIKFTQATDKRIANLNF
ncbi:ATP-binding protein [Solibacillus sp. FSL H8-0523]|uniref:ATP-binding protein n=1 Tax=Solibacillus sp. FSL H8-0523 TaxID=2954511 RepID=UPI003100C8EF